MTPIFTSEGVIGLASCRRCRRMVLAKAVDSPERPGWWTLRWDPGLDDRQVILAGIDAWRSCRDRPSAGEYPRAWLQLFGDGLAEFHHCPVMADVDDEPPPKPVQLQAAVAFEGASATAAAADELASADGTVVVPVRVKPAGPKLRRAIAEWIGRHNPGRLAEEGISVDIPLFGNGVLWVMMSRRMGGDDVRVAHAPIVQLFEDLPERRTRKQVARQLDWALSALLAQS